MNPEIAQVHLAEGKKSILHLIFISEYPILETTQVREKLVCNWLDSIKHDAQQIYLLGDLFDSWMEYKMVVPKGNIRFLGKLAELSDSGIQVIVYTGNHDLWMHGYFQKELNIEVFKEVNSISINSKIFHIGHGDGVSRNEKKYRLMKSIIHHPISQFIYRQLHPDVGLRLADFFSRLGPKHKYQDLKMQSNEEEYQIQYANQCLSQSHVDYFIFGHRHIPVELQLNDRTTFINLGDWISFNTYAVFDGQKASLLKY